MEREKGITQRILEKLREHVQKHHGPKSVGPNELAEGLGTLASHGDPHHDPSYEKTTNKDAANGYPGLDADSAIPIDHIVEKTPDHGVGIDLSLIKDKKFSPDADDANMYFGKVGANFYFLADDLDFILYNRAQNKWSFYIGNTSELEVTADGINVPNGNIAVSGTVDGVDIAARDHAEVHYHTKTVIFKVLAHDTALTTGDAKEYWTVPLALNGWNLTDADAAVYTASSAGGNGAVGPIQIYNLTQTQDMLSTGITLDQDEFNSYTAAAQPVINGATDDVATGDRLRFDVDTAAGTGTTGLDIIMVFTKP